MRTLVRDPQPRELSGGRAWHYYCPCGEPFASVIEDTLHATAVAHLVQFEPVRQRTAEQGIPFYGPSLRMLRGKQPRRKAERLREAAGKRELQADAGAVFTGDYGPIGNVTEFDSVCIACEERVRLRHMP